MGAIHNIVFKPYPVQCSEMVEVKENGEVVKENRGIVKRPDRHYQSRAQRLSGVKQNKHKKLLKVIDIGRFLILDLIL